MIMLFGTVIMQHHWTFTTYRKPLPRFKRWRPSLRLPVSTSRHHLPCHRRQLGASFSFPRCSCPPISSVPFRSDGVWVILDSQRYYGTIICVVYLKTMKKAEFCPNAQPPARPSAKLRSPLAHRSSELNQAFLANQKVHMVFRLKPSPVSLQPPLLNRHAKKYLHQHANASGGAAG